MSLMAESSADIKSVREILTAKQYAVDFYQREYEWGRPQIEQLINDLESKFLTQYKESDNITQVEKYARYYMGVIITSKTDSGHLIIDGQQRLTTITLLLIYLNNLQKKNTSNNVLIEPMIFSEEYGRRYYNVNVDGRTNSIRSLYDEDEFTGNTESEKNIINAYKHINDLFPYDAESHELSYFIWWLTGRVSFAEISMSASDDAYFVFDTMNNRGLGLTNVEMLKGYLLSKTGNRTDDLDKIWQRQMAQIRTGNKNSDAEFFTSWMRGKYLNTAKFNPDAKIEGYENASSQFHLWIKNNETSIGLNMEEDFVTFIEQKFVFYSNQYIKIRKAMLDFDSKLEYLYYIRKLGVAPSFYYAMLLAPILESDGDEIIDDKMNAVAHFLEVSYVTKRINSETTNQNYIKQTMFEIILEIRDKNLDELKIILSKRIKDMGHKLDALETYGITGNTKKYVKYLLARITAHVEKRSKAENYFVQYITNKFSIEHILANDIKYEEFGFKNREEFEEYRNMIGGMILLPASFNQSYGNDPYDKKLEHYFGQNLLAQSLHPKCYENNPNFSQYMKESKIPFKSHTKFKKQDILDRQNLYKKICEEIWSPEEI